MKIVDDIFLKYLPTLDLHGETKDTSRILTKDFILENKTLKQEKIVIIHGTSGGVVKKSVYEELKINPYVISYKQDNFNHGITIVELKVN